MMRRAPSGLLYFGGAGLGAGTTGPLGLAVPEAGAVAAGERGRLSYNSMMSLVISMLSDLNTTGVCGELMSITNM